MSGTLTQQRARVRRPGLPHLVGLDGLRAVAVIAVVLYHADVPGVQGGFLGVDVFFVLSGFLITSLLLVELDRTGRIRFREFYLRRARRLLPALFAVLLVSAVLVATIAYDVAGSFRRDLPGALLYYSNWSNILTDTSYFEFIGRPPMLKHLWSLAVEEQFYLIWPVVALMAHRWRGARAVGLVAVGGAVLSTVAMAAGATLGRMPAEADPSRLYFGTDTHSMGVLVGAALAVLWRPGRTSPVLARQAQVVVTAAGVAALALLCWAFTTFGEYSPLLYRGGFLLVALVSAVVVAAASHRGVPFGRWLGIRPMRWIGERSYGIYLWHWPLFLVTRPGVDIPLEGAAALGLRLILLLLVAEVSYRYLEMPIRRGALGQLWERVRDRDVRAPGRAAVAAGVAAAAVLGLSAVRVASAPDPASAGGISVEQLAMLAPARAPLEMDFVRMRAAEGLDPRPRATAFGDSVLLGGSRALEAVFNVDLQAHVAEQAATLAQRIANRAAAGDLRPLALVHVGNNGIVTEDQLRAMLDDLASVPRVVLVTVRVPRPWMAPNNALIARVAEDYPNVVVADWAAESEGRRDYLVKDGVHLSALGAAAYRDLIARVAGVRSEQ